MTTKLSERLRGLKAAIQGGNNAHARKLVHECIAQAEALEAQAGEWSDEVIEQAHAIQRFSIASNGRPGGGRLVQDDGGDVILYVDHTAIVRSLIRHHGYLRPSQAIGEQTPVAPAPVCMGCFSQEAVCRQPGLCVSGRPKWTSSPMSSEARDKAIEAGDALNNAIWVFLKTPKEDGVDTLKMLDDASRHWVQAGGTEAWHYVHPKNRREQ